MSVRHVRVGDVLALRRTPVELRPDQSYVEIGIRSFGRGTFLKDAVSGASLGTKRVYAIHPGDLLVSNVFAWEGAIAVAGVETAGCIGSHRFMTWVPASADIDIEYLSQFFASERGLEMIGKASPGSEGRNRTLGIKSFANLVIPLPDIAEQRRIAARLDRIHNWAASLLNPISSGFSKAMSRSAARTLMRELPRTLKVGADLEVLGGGTPDKANMALWDGRVPWVTPADLGQLRRRSVTISARTVSPNALTGGGTRHVPAGSVIMSSRAPIGHLAIARVDASTNQGCKSFVPPSRLTSEFLYFALMASLDEIEAAGSGTTFHEVSAAKLRGLRLPVTTPQNQAELVRRLSKIQDRVWALDFKRREAVKLAFALLPAARNEEFAKLR